MNVPTKAAFLSTCVEKQLWLGSAGEAKAHWLICWGQVCTPEGELKPCSPAWLSLSWSLSSAQG